MVKQNIVKEKAFELALKTISLCDDLNDQNEYVISKQLLKSATSIGANISESRHAESKADFIHKLSISLKESYETEYWLQLLFQSHKISHKTFGNLNKLNSEIIKILCRIILTSKRTS